MTFADGFLHPITGIDHFIPMVVLGLWAAQRGSRAGLLTALAFPAFMAAGGALALAGFPMPRVEEGIAASALVLGLLVMTSARLPVAAAVLLAAVFAVLHGHAHGAEIPAGASAAGWVSGFVLGTLGLHLAGIALGQWARTREPLRVAVRAAGGLASAAGAVFLVRALA